jgi:arginyl-tRNA synthetase
VGLHVAKAIWGKIQKPDLNWGEAYAYGAQNFDENKEAITEINKKIFEKSDGEINKLYKKGKNFSLDFFGEIYERLDSNFDYHFYESQAGEVGKKIVLENVGKIFEKSDGAVIFRGEDFNPQTHTRVFINSEGLPTYEAKEVGLAEIKKEKYKYNKSITVTANEQDAFFDVVEMAIGQVFPEIRDRLIHLSHGMLKLPTGKMSSRTGDVITAEDLIAQVKEKVLEKIADRNFGEKAKDDVAEMVAIGAIKYSILKQAIGGDIIFDFDKSISFEGDSGPYLQYTAVRANSILEKTKVSRFNLDMSRSVLDTWKTTELERYLYRFPEVVERAGREYAPHYITTYLTELASTFNAFYANNKIIDEGDQMSPYKIALTAATSSILKSGLYLLGIKVPEKM